MIRSRIRRSRTLSVRPRPYRSKLSATRISAGCLRFLILSQTFERPGFDPSRDSVSLAGGTRSRVPPPAALC
jgi:hypothetical protein